MFCLTLKLKAPSHISVFAGDTAGSNWGVDSTTAQCSYGALSGRLSSARRIRACKTLRSSRGDVIPFHVPYFYLLENAPMYIAVFVAPIYPI